MCRFAWLWISLFLTASARADDGLEATARRIRSEVVLPNDGPAGRPLPLAGHWNTGETGDGLTPRWQWSMIEAGHHLLPWFKMPFVLARKNLPDDYYASIEHCAAHRLPISFIGTQWQELLVYGRHYVSLPIDENPNVVTSAGDVRRQLSPFGPTDPWQRIGAERGAAPQLLRLEARYPDPPRLLMISNNEAPRLRWTEVEQSKRYLDRFGAGRDAAFKRRVVGEGWIALDRALQAGLRSGFDGAGWRERVRFVGFDAFGPWFFGRWPLWQDYALAIPGRISIAPFAWDGGSAAFYANNWEPIADDMVYSPQVQAMNWVFMLDQTRKQNPDFWFELSVWDGHEPGAPSDKRAFYERQGQHYSPERYLGMVQFGMWLLRPRLVREFRPYRATRADCEPYFLPVVRAVDRLHGEEVLPRFWRHGRLVANTKHRHPYQTLIPAEYALVDRWYLLDTDLDPRRPWSLYTHLPVFALALVEGQSPRRRWLLYAHSPLGDRQGVAITVPDYRTVTVAVALGGSFYLVEEASGRVTPLNRAGDGSARALGSAQ